MLDEKRGLWDNIHAKRKRIAAGSGERMRKPGEKGAPSAADLKASQVKEDAEKHSKDPRNPASRFDASDELVKTYKDETPGQSKNPSKTLKVLRKVVEEALYECNGNCTCGKHQPPVTEAEYQGRSVPIGKPMQGDVKKSKVYVKNEKGNVVKVNFGDKNMTIKKNIPARRKSFRARHNCDNPGPRTKARYWSCRAW
jgi:hypothetical protein